MNRRTATLNPADAVTWSVQPSSPDGFYDSQSTLAIGATALPGFRFRQWAGDLSGVTPSGTLDMRVPRTIQAILDRVPFVAPPGVVNGAGTTPQTGLAPGSIGSIFGGMLANGTQIGPSSQLPQTLAGVTVTIGNRILPLFYASPTQINFLLPSDLPLGQAVAPITTP